MTYKQMEDVTGLTKKTIISIIKKLEDKGYIEVEHNKDNYIYSKEKKKPISKPNKYKYNLLCVKTYKIIKGGCFFMSKKEIEKILKRMDQRYNILLELCKQMGINVDQFSKGVQVQYGQKQ